MVLSGMVPGSMTLHSAEVLAEIARILKPGGRVLLKEPVAAQIGKSESAMFLPLDLRQPNILSWRIRPKLKGQEL